MMMVNSLLGRGTGLAACNASVDASPERTNVDTVAMRMRDSLLASFLISSFLVRGFLAVSGLGRSLRGRAFRQQALDQRLQMRRIAQRSATRGRALFGNHTLSVGHHALRPSDALQLRQPQVTEHGAPVRCTHWEPRIFVTIRHGLVL